MNNSPTYFDPETLSRIQPFSLRVRTLIEGLMAGMHRSQLHGHSIEFAEHREYTPGDDVRQVDWKVFARSDRYYLKQYEDETTLNCYLLLDQSESMSYRGETSPLSKLEYARLVACSLLYLVIHQQDRAGLLTFSSQLDGFLPAQASPTQLEDAIRLLEQPGSHGKKTAIAKTLEEALHRITRPGLIVLVSDLFCDIPDTTRAFKLARHAGHDLMVLHILDSDELLFPFDSMSCFEGLEDALRFTLDPLMIAGAYRKAIHEYKEQLRTHCQELGAEYFELQTCDSLATRLPQILASRGLKGTH